MTGVKSSRQSRHPSVKQQVNQLENTSNTSSGSDSEFFLGTTFMSDDTDDEDNELVERKGIKQVNANECNVIGTSDGPEQNNNIDNQGDNTFTTEYTDDYDDDWHIDLETNGSNVHYTIDTSAQANVLPLNVYRCS